jgi:F-type H+-transporting ATPase subunit alpha
MLGRVVDALGQPVDGLGPIKAKEEYPVEKIAP